MIDQKKMEMLRQAKEDSLQRVRNLVRDRHIHGVPEEIQIDGRIHKVLHYPSGKETAPVYFDIHGGGFVWGMMEEGDLLCHHINEQLGFEVYALDYPLGPDVRFPAALFDLYEVIRYMRDNAVLFHIDPDRMAVGGRSAGGNLAAALCLLAKERGEFQFAAQVLDHPYLDLCGLIPGSQRYQEEGALPYELMNELAAAYAEDEERKSILCSPLAADREELMDLPPAVIQTCEFDSLRQDGDQYAEKLLEAGVQTIHHCYPGVTHGFTELEGPEEIPGQNWLIEALGLLMLTEKYRKGSRNE